MPKHVREIEGQNMSEFMSRMSVALSDGMADKMSGGTSGYIAHQDETPGDRDHSKYGI